MSDNERQRIDDLVAFTLKTCPFCGRDAIMETFTTAMEKKPRFRVRCSSCWCMTDWDAWSIDEAARRWNEREKSDDDAGGSQTGTGAASAL